MQQNTHFSQVHILQERSHPRLQNKFNNLLNFNKFNKIEIIQSIFFLTTVFEIQINSKKKAGKITNTWKLNNMLVNNCCVNKEIKGEIKKYLKTNEINIQHTKTFGMQKIKVILRRDSTIGLSQETRKILPKQYNFTLKRTRRTNEAQS